MRTTRIDLEGPTGRYATVTRKTDSRIIEVTVLTPERPDGETMRANATYPDSRRYAAAWLQKRLDGFAGTKGDRVEYELVLDAFADED